MNGMVLEPVAGWGFRQIHLPDPQQRYRVEAAGSPGMAAGYTVEGKFAAIQRAMTIQRLHGISTAGWQMPAGCRGEGRNHILIHPDNQQQRQIQQLIHRLTKISIAFTGRMLINGQWP